MHLSRNTLILIAVLAVFAIGTAIAVYSISRTSGDATSELRSTNHFYRYPARYDLEEYRNGSTLLGSYKGSKFQPTLAVTVVENDGTTAYTDVDAFLLAQALLLCSPDLPGETLTCAPTPEIARAFTTVSKLPATEYYFSLSRTNVESGETTVERFGPVYAMPMGTSTDPSDFEGLLIYPPVYAVPFGEAPADLAARIVDTVVFR